MLKVYDELQDSLQILESFFALRIDVSDVGNSELCDLFGLDDAASRIPDVAQICPFELTLLLEAFNESQQNWKKLQWFERVNADAVGKILDKLGRREQADNLSYRKIRSRWQVLRTEWDNEVSVNLERIRSLIADANNGLALPRRTTGKSLYLARAFSSHPWSKAFIDEIIQAAQSGDFNFVIEALASKSSIPKVSERMLRNLASDLLRFSIMMRPEQAKTFLYLLP